MLYKEPENKAIVSAIQALDDAINTMKKQRAALVSTLPPPRQSQKKRTVRNPLTGKMEEY